MAGEQIKIGFGYDVHRFVKERSLVLGGVQIPHEKGLLGFSDADVLTHAVMDAILGALGKGDLGRHFPDTDPTYQGAESLSLLKKVIALAHNQGFTVNNLDATIVAQRPKLAPYVADMEKKLSSVLGVKIQAINIKATTTEGLGFCGKEEGIAAYSVVTLRPL